jgi:hypothetical protein
MPLLTHWPYPRFGGEVVSILRNVSSNLARLILSGFFAGLLLPLLAGFPFTDAFAP